MPELGCRPSSGHFRRLWAATCHSQGERWGHGRPAAAFKSPPPSPNFASLSREQEQQAEQERSAAAALNQKAQHWLRQVRAQRAQQPQQPQHAQGAQQQQDDVQHTTREPGEVRQRREVEARSEAKRTAEEERQPPLH